MTESRELSPAEVLSLAGLLFFLPLLEAPKNLFWLAFVLIWFGRSVFTGAGWGGTWRSKRDLSFLALLAAACTACLLAPPFPQKWNEVGDVLRYALIGWLISRSRFSEKQLFLALIVTLVGTLVAAVHGWWEWKVVETTSMFELNSVGHTNHSAIYLCMVALGTLGSLIAAWDRLSNGWRIPLILALLFLTWLLATGESRGALVAYVIGFILIVACVAPAKWSLRILSLFLVSLVTILMTQPYLFDKSVSQLVSPATTTKTSYRMELARTALIATEIKPLSGIGPGNFGLMNAKRVAAHLEHNGKLYEPWRYFHSSHSHNIYMNTLAERGFLGMTALGLLMYFWVRKLIEVRQHHRSTSQQQLMLWSVGMAGFVGVFITGIFNTSLHHEHGLLSMFALGLLMGQD